MFFEAGLVSKADFVESSLNRCQDGRVHALRELNGVKHMIVLKTTKAFFDQLADFLIKIFLLEVARLLI